METPTSAGQDLFASRLDSLAEVPLFDAILDRRSRRFALGHDLRGGPLEYRSAHDPVPLTEEEEAIIVYAATGYTGYALGEAPYAPGPEPESSNGNIMIRPLGRTTASPDSADAATLFVFNDDGAFMIRRPHDYPREELPELVELARRRDYVELYRRARIRVLDHRPELPRRPPFTPPFNRWSTNLPGTTYFLLISDVTPFVFSLLFFIFGEEMGFTFFDERHHYLPAGLKRFMRSKGGHLHDDPNEERVATIFDFESYAMELAGVEQGLILQNLALAVESLGLGGFPHFGAQKYQWLEALGFRMEEISLADYTRRSPVVKTAMKLMKKNPSLMLPLGLEVDGQVLMKPYSPPWYDSMEAAIHQYLDAKYGENGAWTDPNFGPWQDNATVQAGIERYSQANIDAVIAYATYVYERYGRFPGLFGPLRSLMAFQAHHLDLEFYDRFYAPGAYTDRHREHFARWHGGAPQRKEP
ncbi:MAG: hypothetical protein ACXVRE_10660 [Gaiellaceae bacterium]